MTPIERAARETAALEKAALAKALGKDRDMQRKFATDDKADEEEGAGKRWCKNKAKEIAAAKAA